MFICGNTKLVTKITINIGAKLLKENSFTNLAINGIPK